MATKTTARKTSAKTKRTQPSLKSAPKKKPSPRKPRVEPAAAKPATVKSDERILIIKHGALGDFILSTGPMAAIRKHHPKAHIVLLTTQGMKDLAKACPYVDEIWIDERAPLLSVEVWWPLLSRIRKARFRRVYDLQTSTRTNMYFRLIGRKKPEWNGIISWCSHPHKNPARTRMHTIDRQRDQLQAAGINDVPAPDLSWLKADITRYKLPKPFAVLVPGGSAHRPEKRWSLEGFAEVARFLVSEGITPVFVGTFHEQETIVDIISEVKGSISLCGQTNFAELAELGRRAILCVGNDTGPMHILALGGKPTISLFSAFSDPKLCAPRGANVRVMEEEDLPSLKARDVISMIKETLKLDTE